MEYIATQRFIRISPKKMRLLVASIKDLSPMRAIEILPYVGKRSAEPLLKVMKTAVANARTQGADVEKLVFKEIQIGEGPRLKRGNPVSRGRFHPIKKRMSHIRVIVELAEEKKGKLAVAKAKAK
jgi:large subunit ribosomal protein L22